MRTTVSTRLVAESSLEACSTPQPCKRVDSTAPPTPTTTVTSHRLFQRHNRKTKATPQQKCVYKRVPTLTLWHVLRRVHTIQQSPRSEKPPNAQKLEVQVQHGEQCKFSTAQRIVVQFRVVAIFSHGADVNVVAKDFKDNKATDAAYDVGGLII